MSKIWYMSTLMFFGSFDSSLFIWFCENREQFRITNEKYHLYVNNEIHITYILYS